MINLSKKAPIVSSDKPIGLVGGGFVGPNDLNLMLNRVESVVAADGGAGVLVESGHVPDAVIGDFDSLGQDVRAQIPKHRLFPVREQDSTDFDKVLRHAQTPLALGVGFLGRRLDHQLAVLNSLVRQQDRFCILLGARELVFHAPPRLSLELTSDDVVSLFPLARVTGRSTGLEWPIDGLVLEPDGQVGTSNRAVSHITLAVDGPGLLVMVPRDRLDQVMQAFLSGQTGHWPARAE